MRQIELKKEIQRMVAAGEARAALAALQELWREASNPATAAFVLSQSPPLRASLAVPSHRLAILRSFTVEPLIPSLRAAALCSGIGLETHIGEFNAYAQEMLDAGSALYQFAPDTAILAVQARDCAPDLWRDYADLSPEQAAAAVRRTGEQFGSWIAGFRRHSNANLIVHTLELPEAPRNGILDAQAAGGQAAAIGRINDELRRQAAEFAGVYLLDYDGLVSRHGRAAWHDERKWLTVRLPIAAGCLMHLVEEWLRYLHPLAGRTAKAVVVDLDNTLWGGVIGEDGMEGIRLGQEYPGAAYQALQRVLLDLRRRGILLAIASKNNPGEAMEVLEKHPGMLLRPADFAAVRINWNEKARSLREIAGELNIGIDSLAFLDDNPVERQHIRRELPEVAVIELAAEPMGYARALQDAACFERLQLSAEDRQRGEYYAAQRQRQELESGATSREDFLRSLEQEAEIAAVTPMTLGRVAQLTQKTNQFNVTTRRYSEQQIAAMAACPGWEVLSIQVRDRFADNGLVGVAITQMEGDACRIDTFLLSCRVIGRSVETAFLAHVVERARAAGASRVQGWFLPTRKNAPASEFYASHGFRAVEQKEDGTLWELDLSRQTIECPEWVRLRAAAGANA